MLLSVIVQKRCLVGSYFCEAWAGVCPIDIRLNERLFQNLASAVRALRGSFQNVIRHAGI
jgi:hypothetical protein